MKSLFIRSTIYSLILTFASIATPLFGADLSLLRIAGVDSMEAKEGHITIHLGTDDSSTQAVDPISAEAHVCGIMTAIGILMCLDWQHTLGAQPVSFLTNNQVVNFLVSTVLFAYVTSAASWAFAGIYHPIIKLLKASMSDSDNKIANLTVQELFIAGLKNWPEIRKYVAPEYQARGDALYNEFLQKAMQTIPAHQLTDIHIKELGATVTPAAITPVTTAAA